MGKETHTHKYFLIILLTQYNKTFFGSQAKIKRVIKEARSTTLEILSFLSWKLFNEDEREIKWYISHFIFYDVWNIACNSGGEKKEKNSQEDCACAIFPKYFLCSVR